MPMTFAREAWPFVIPPAALAAVLFFLGHNIAGWIFAALAFGILLFFRDPRRQYDGDPDVILAAADGLVTQVGVVEEPDIGGEPYQRVVTFLSVFDVHVQRVPTTGEIVSSALKRGQKVAAFRHDADEVNEAHLTVLRRPSGDLIGIKQVVGLVARRIVCYLSAGQKVERGEHLGLIKFGSRVDIFVPQSYEILVKKGDRLKNGLTPVARPAAPDEGGP